MTAAWFDPTLDDDARRKRVYNGELFLYSNRKASRELAELAQELLTEAFGGQDPRTAQHHLAVKEFAQILSQVKPKFIHHPRCKQIVPALLESLGCDPEKTYFDVPRLRSATSDEYLTTGIAYQFHPHRDTWYSAPMCQINWWLPVYELGPENGMAFHPRYFTQGIRNGSAAYDYQKWIAESRFAAAQQIGKDERPQPHAEEPVELQPDLRLTPPVGGVMIFSAAHLHSSVENRTGVTRYSIDFRTVHGEDVAKAIGAPNVDSYCTGTTMGDYLRCRDLAHLDDRFIQQYMPGHPQAVASEPRRLEAARQGR
jgi:hypothetical protein